MSLKPPAPLDVPWMRLQYWLNSQHRSTTVWLPTLLLMASFNSISYQSAEKRRPEITSSGCKTTPSVQVLAFSGCRFTLPPPRDDVESAGFSVKRLITVPPKPPHGLTFCAV